MVKYDPFISNDQGNDAAHNSFLPRRAPILATRLADLEWSVGPARKRPRMEPSQASAPIEYSAPPNTNDTKNVHATGASSNFAAPSSHASKPEPSVRIIEKPVPIEPTTIMGDAPLVDDRIRHLVQFILKHVDGPNVEIEAKLGILLEKENSSRVTDLVPVMCETPIRESSNADVRFVSNVGEGLFQSVNQRLNVRVEETAKQSDGAVKYVRTRETDVYYPGRVRQTKVQTHRSQTRDEYKVVRTQRKTRLGDLNILCPNTNCDVRYSASKEEDCNAPTNSRSEMSREKDRVSYKYEYVSVDITNVEAVTKSGMLERTHEVEVEIDSSSNLYDEVKKYHEGDQSSKLFDIATCFVNTVRLLLEL